MSLFRKLAYSPFVATCNKGLLSLFYDRRYLTGKFFDEQRFGFVWAWKGIFRSLRLRRRGIRWPVGKSVRIPSGKNLQVDPSSLNVFQQPGCYFQNYHGKITIGKDVWIAQNVGIITENHNPANPDEHLPAKDVVIGDHCWIGMNALILPGVELGEYTTVGGGAVVTHSFPGHCVVAGNPARVLRTFEVKDGKEG